MSSNDNMNKIISFPPSNNFTPKQALESALQNVNSLTDVVVMAYDTDGDLYLRSSKMTRADGLWFAKQFELYALGLK